MRIAVLGGGLSGLTAAFYLHRFLPQATIRLFEASDRVGGVIETECRDGWLIEHGADCFSTNPPDALRLCQDLGVADTLIEPEAQGRRAMISRGARLYPVPEGFVLMRPTKLGPVLRSPLLSLPGKLRLLGERFVRRRTNNDDESLAEFVRRRLGNEALERLVQPLVAGIYTADATRLSMQATMPQFVAMERQYGSLIGARRERIGGNDSAVERQSSGARYGQFRAFPQGMGRLFQWITEALPEGTIRSKTAARTVSRADGGGWRIALSDDSEIVVDGIVLALPATVSAGLLAPIAPEAAQQLGGIEYASSAVVLVGAKKSQIARLPDAFGFVVPAVDRRRILAASFASHKFPGRAPAGHALIRVFIGGALQSELLQHTDEQLMEIARHELQDLIGLEGRPEWMSVQRWKNAMPQYHVGHRQRVARIEQAVSQLPGLEIAGNSMHGVGIAPVVGAARRAAERLAATLT